MSAWLAAQLPGWKVLRHYQRSWLRGDLLAGLTVAAYLIPQVMAYAEVARLPAVVGLWAIMLPLVAYAVVGSSRLLSVGPESTTALMTAAAIAAMSSTGPAHADPANTAACLALAVGVICVLARVARLGFLSDLLSRPVLVGYLAGIAVLMIASQLGKVTGLKLSADSVGARALELARRAGEVHLPTLAMAGTCVVALFLLRRFVPMAPGPLVVMLVAAAAAHWAWPTAGLAVVGRIPAGLPTPMLPDFTAVDLFQLLPAALGVAVVGFSDNVLTGRAFAAKHNEDIDADQELLALGVANVVTAFSHGFPVSSSGSRTVLADMMGARSQLYSLVSLVVVIIAMFFAGPVLAAFPMAALGAVIVYAALRLIDLHEFRRLAHFRRAEVVLALLTTVSVVTFDVLAGIGVAVALSVLDLVRRLFSPHDAVLGYVPGVAGMHDVDDFPHTTTIPGLLVYRYDAPLFFANSENLVTRALRAVEKYDGREPIRWFVLNAEANVDVDLTAVDALERLRSSLANRGIIFALARVKQEVREQLEIAGFLDKVGPDRVFATLPTAVEGYCDWVEATDGRRPTVPVLGPGMVWRQP